MSKYCFGIDVGGTTVKCGLFTVDGEMLEKWEIITRTENHGENILPDVAETIRKKMQERAINASEVAGVGIGVPGPVDSKGNVAFAVNLGWGRKELARELSELTGLRAEAGNDANVAALGEAWKGAAAGAQNAIMLTLGTGVGGGIIANGQIVAGQHGAGGEVGHANINHEETAFCNCGNHGCVEQYGSATGIVRLAKMERAGVPKDQTALWDSEDFDAKHVLDAFKAGDEIAVRVMEKVGEKLGGALAIFTAVVDPESIVLGGGVSRAGQPLIDVIGKYYRQYAFSMCKETPIVIATLGNDAGMYGAAKLVLNEK